VKPLIDTNEFKEMLREKGFRFTEQREAILDTIIKYEGSHLNSEDIYNKVKVIFPEIGIATVYRTLSLLEEMGIIYSSYFGDGIVRYELAKKGEKHKHHHLVCNNCGSIIEVEEDLLASIEQWIFERYGFKVKNHVVKFFGLCKNCDK
jgi:Fur family ferric uptake transcriptional regulator